MQTVGAAVLVASAPLPATAYARPRAVLRPEHPESAKAQPAAPKKAPPAKAPSAKVQLTTTANSRVPNELGRIPIVEWHQVVAADGAYKVSRERFGAELRELYARGYVPVSLSELLDKTMNMPAGKSPVLLTFDDAPPSQFRYLERNGALLVDPTSAVGMLLGFIKLHPDWKAKGLFCMLPAAEAGHAFFGDKGIDGQKTAWRDGDRLRRARLPGARVCAAVRIMAETPCACVQRLVIRHEAQARRALPSRRRARSVGWSSAEPVRSGVQSEVVAAGAATGRHHTLHDTRPDGQAGEVGALRLRRQSEDDREALARSPVVTA